MLIHAFSVIPQFQNLEQAWDLIQVIAFQLIPGHHMFGRQPSIFGHFFLWAGDRMRDLPGAWYRIRWQKIQLSDCALIWDGFMIASLTTASFVIPKKTWLWLHRQIRDVHRDSAIDNFVEVCYLSWLYWYNHTHCLRLIPTRAHIPTPEMRNSTLNKIQALYQWNAMLCLGYRAYEVVGWS